MYRNYDRFQFRKDDKEVYGEDEDEVVADGCSTSAISR